MVERTNPKWVRFGRELRRIRDQSGLSQQQLGREISVSHAMISAMERGARGARREHVERIDQVLSTGGTLVRALERLSEHNGFPTWFRGVVSLEQQATEIKSFQPLLVHGLLQTEDYARTILRDGRPMDTDAEIEELVQARMARQSILASDHAPLLLLVLDETAIQRPVGGPRIMRAQLDHLLEASESSRVTLQIVPLATENNPGLSGPFTLLYVQGADILYMETPLSGAPVEALEEVSQYARLLGDIRGVALPPRESRKLIEAARGEFT
ncbi:helix-turn-helix domain-containing protein [Streptomonospora sp. S1-112]|uniref:Helix-turn-helix domain-containing protein n=1 Tax=Streptomonospora mangrovi TaxID=2883123 RepID=A0A9X3SEM4_9ACTN|nr:helix-turn-helix transcriptional regulator [Streptomonospora mangrovi]MDA0566038.1 helix-turn-helix domain-containing protein [Streptomonospora mangrovi]